MSEISDCIKNNTLTKDGVVLSGHSSVAKVAFIDKDTNRTYFVDECDNCGRYEINFSKGSDSKEVNRYPQARTVGDR